MGLGFWEISDYGHNWLLRLSHCDKWGSLDSTDKLGMVPCYLDPLIKSPHLCHVTIYDHRQLSNTESWTGSRLLKVLFPATRPCKTIDYKDVLGSDAGSIITVCLTQIVFHVLWCEYGLLPVLFTP